MQLMTAGECAEYLKVSKAQIYQMRASHRIPYTKIGGNVRFDQEEIDIWLKENSVKPKTKGN